MSGTVWYCYAVARPFSTDGLGGLRGVLDAEVTAMRHEELVAVVSAVSADEFDELSLPANAENLAWLEPVARAHNAVVERVAQRTVTLPFRLATIYSDRQAVRSLLAAHDRELSEALDRVSGRVELGVKVYTAVPSTSSGDSPAEAERGGTIGRAGLSYLRRKRAERDAKEAGWHAAVRRSVEIDDDLTELSAGRCQHGVQSADLSAAGEQNVLNVAYLVAEDAIDRFLARVRALQDEAPSCRIDVTGPWAPYSFALRDDSAEAPAEGSQA
jgi:hypothetical protein